MAPEKDNEVPKLVQGFLRIHEEYLKILDDPTNGFPYRGGACLDNLDVADMRIVFDAKANSNYWKPSDASITCALEESFDDYDTQLDERKTYKEKLTEHHDPTIGDAYIPSTEYTRMLQLSVYWGLFHNEALLDPSGYNLFQTLRASFYWSHVHVETSEVFCSPGYPHITILSLQPHRALSQKDLLSTEFWMMYYWAQKFARRAIHATDHCLPMRFVSLCGYEARMVSAVFSLGYPRSIVKGLKQDLKCQIHIAEYRDLSIRRNFQDLLEELAATPCGNANVPQKSPSKITI